VKFETKSMLYMSPHFKDVIPLPCKTQKTETHYKTRHINVLK